MLLVLDLCRANVPMVINIISQAWYILCTEMLNEVDSNHGKCEMVGVSTCKYLSMIGLCGRV